MAYKLFGLNGLEIKNADLQNKGLWCRQGASEEEVFVDIHGADLGLKINPEKVSNPYAPDLINSNNGNLGDLKIQKTPFFQARARFGLDPQYTVVFNYKDYSRYLELYPNLEIYFAVDWQALVFESSTRIQVDPMVGVWYIPFQKLKIVCDSSPLHQYQQRVHDTQGNAKSSFVLNLLDQSFTRLI